MSQVNGLNDQFFVNGGNPRAVDVVGLRAQMWRPLVIANRSQNPNISPSTGFTKITWRTTCKAMFNCANLKLAFDWWYAFSDGEHNPANGVALKCAVEYPANSGTTYPGYFNGQRVANLDAGGSVTFDVPGLKMSAGDQFQVRVMQDFTNYGTTTAGYLTNISSYGSFTSAPNKGGNNEGFTTNSDVVDSGSIASLSDGTAYGPSQILGFTADSTAVAPVALIGDSLTAATTGASWGGYGWAQQALEAAGIPYICIGQGGEPGSTFKSLASSYRRRQKLAGCQAAIVLYGTNDLNGGQTAAQVQATLQSIYSDVAALGIPVYGVTIPPRTTSTDNWRTVGNQTPASSEANRVVVNTWIRTAPSPLSGVIDLASVFEVNSSGVKTINGGYWPAATKTLASQQAVSPFNTTSLFVAGTPFTVDTMRTQLVVMTGGTGSGQTNVVHNNTNNGFAFSNALTTAPDGTTVFDLWQTWTNDGIHPSGYGYAQGAAVVPTSLFTR